MKHEKAFRNRRVIVTGGAGFIGSAIVKRLLLAGAQVTVVDSLIPEYGGNLFNLAGAEGPLRVNISDVRDPHSMKFLVQGMDYVFNLAGQTSHLDSMHDPFTDLEINSRAQLSILEALRLHNPTACVVFASTRQIYGRPEYLPVDERHPLHPVDVNGINKIAGEQYHVLYSEVYGLRCAALRLTNTYGPGMRIKDARQTFVGIWIRRVLEGQPFEVWGGEQKRDFNYVDDVVDAFLLAALHAGRGDRIFNLGSPEVICLDELARLLVDINKGGHCITREFPAERRKIDIGDYYSDYTRAREQLGWNPGVSLREGLSRTLEFFRANLEHYL